MTNPQLDCLLLLFGPFRQVVFFQSVKIMCSYQKH